MRALLWVRACDAGRYGAALRLNRAKTMTQPPAEPALAQILRRLDTLEARLVPPPMLAEGDLLAAEIQLRRIRTSAFPADYFADLLWSVLLDLYLASFGSSGRGEAELEQRLRLSPDRLQPLVERLIDDGYAELFQDGDQGPTRLRLTRLGVMTMQAVFARTQGSIGELRAAA